MNRLFRLSLAILLAAGLAACSSDDNDDHQATEISPVNFDINRVPYEKLSEYNFFKGEMKNMDPVFGVLPYQTASPFFLDYADSERFVWMPEGVSATLPAEDEPFLFPQGAILIYNSYYKQLLPQNSQKILESRVMIKKGGTWVMANYIWNEDQTEAHLDTEGFKQEISFVHEGDTKNLNYLFPSAGECVLCHQFGDVASPLGVKAINMDLVLNYAEGGPQNQLDKWKEVGYLSGNPPGDMVSLVDYRDTSESLDMRARSYFDVNCGYCHRPGGFADFYPLSLNFTPEIDFEAMGFCATPIFDMNNYFPDMWIDYVILPGDHLKSSVWWRMNSLNPEVVMPVIGKDIIDTEGLELTGQWIDSFDFGCE